MLAGLPPDPSVLPCWSPMTANMRPSVERTAPAMASSFRFSGCPGSVRPDIPSRSNPARPGASSAGSVAARLTPPDSSRAATSVGTVGLVTGTGLCGLPGPSWITPSLP